MSYIAFFQMAFAPNCAPFLKIEPIRVTPLSEVEVEFYNVGKHLSLQKPRSPPSRDVTLFAGRSSLSIAIELCRARNEMKWMQLHA